MPSIGQLLKQQREAKRIGLAEIARETRISTRYLEAIESDDTRTLPKDFFYRSFVRQYATYLGVTAEVDTALQLEMGSAAPESVAAPVARPAATVLFPASEAKRPVVRPALDQSFLSESRTGKGWLALAAILLVGSVSYLVWRKMPSAPAPDVAATKSGAPAVNQPVSQSPVTPSNPPGGLVGGPNGAPTAVVQAGKLKITISAKEPTWVQVVGDGRSLYVGLLEAGQTTEVESSEGKAELLIGNAGGVSVQHNGKPIPEIGPRGQVRTVVFDSEKYEVRVPVAKPKPDEVPADKKDNSTVDSSHGGAFRGRTTGIFV